MSAFSVDALMRLFVCSLSLNRNASLQIVPKRPMSGYNLFFQLERERLLSGQPVRNFTREDVDRIADAQKLKDLSAQPKRKHRKSHGSECR